MTARETIMSFLKGKLQNGIPFSTYAGSFVPRGEKGRTLRNEGLILIELCSATLSQYHNVEVEIKGAQAQLSDKEKSEPYDRIWTRTYHTPVGDISEKIRREPIHGTSDWVVEHLIKKPSDYRILQYILENRTHDENWEGIKRAQSDLGEDGIVYAEVDRSPLQQLMIEWVGVERFCLDYHDHLDPIEKLLSVAEEKQDLAYDIAAHSPAEVVWAPDNLMGDVAGPALYQKYLLPFYNRQAELLHKAGKLYAVHMDGRLASLADLIKRTNIDIVESFTLPEAGGDLPLKKALEMWKKKSITANIPAFLGNKSSKEVRDYIRGLKKDVLGVHNFAIGFYEDIPLASLLDTLSVIGETLTEKGTILE